MSMHANTINRAAAPPRRPVQLLSFAEATTRLVGSWGSRRGAGSDLSQLRKAIETVLAVLDADADSVGPAHVSSEQLAQAVAQWQAQGLSTATINKRLCVLSALGINAAGNWQRDRRPLKWWLHPDKGEKLLEYLRSEPTPFPAALLTADYVEWSMLVGMRVEESLRLTWSDVHLSFERGDDGATVSRSEVTVPGTKTAGAQASIAIALRPALLLQRRFEGRKQWSGVTITAREPGQPDREVNGATLVFPVHYDQLHHYWDKCRDFLGVRDNPLSTLRALRRTSARHLTTKGMPLDIVRQYLRHRDIKTTLGYLRLVGGYTTEEQRKWL